MNTHSQSVSRNRLPREVQPGELHRVPGTEYLPLKELLRSGRTLAELLLPPLRTEQTRQASSDLQRPDTTVIIPTYRETEEIQQSVGSFLLFQDTALKERIALMIVVDGHPAPPEPDNDTLRVLRVLLGLAADDPGLLIPGHFRLWKGFVNGIPFALYVKLPEMARGKRMSQVLVMDLLALRERELGWCTPVIINQDCDTRVTERQFAAMRKHMLDHPTLFAVCPTMEMVNKNPWDLFGWIGHHYELQVIPNRHAQTSLGFTDVVTGAFSAFNWKCLKEVLDDYAQPVEPGDLIGQVLHMGEDGWLAILGTRRGHRIAQTQIEAQWVLPNDVAGTFAQRRRWINARMVHFYLVIRGLMGIRDWKIRSYVAATRIPDLLGFGASLGTLWSLSSLSFGGRLEVDVFFMALLVGSACLGLYWAGKEPKEIEGSLRLSVGAGNVLGFLLGLLLLSRLEALDYWTLAALLSVALFPMLAAPLVVSHPRRWLTNLSCAVGSLLHGITGPLFLLYSLANLDNFRWGTRERSSDKAAYAVPQGAQTPATSTDGLETQLGLHRLLYHRDHFGLSDAEITSRLAAVGRTKWTVLGLYLLLSTVVALGCRYLPLPLLELGGLRLHPLALAFIGYQAAILYLSLFVGMARVWKWGPARTPLGLSQDELAAWPPRVPIERIPLRPLGPSEGAGEGDHTWHPPHSLAPSHLPQDPANVSTVAGAADVFTRARSNRGTAPASPFTLDCMGVEQV